MNTRSLAVYHQAIRKSFGFLKRSSSITEVSTRMIPLPGGVGALVPIADLNVDDDVLIAQLAEWRVANQAAYPTRFPVTIDGTKKWLKDRMLAVDDRLLFLVLDRHGNRIGHFGFANCVNDVGEMAIDNVVRGVAGAAPGLMQAAMAAAIEWAHTTIGPAGFFLRVFANNQHAVRFYERGGFAVAEQIPLRRHQLGHTESYEPLTPEDKSPPDAIFLKMRLQPRPATGEKMILTAGPSVGEREAHYAWDAARTGWNSKWSCYLTAFEKAFAEYIGAKHCMATSCCTGALHIALAALDIGPGDEVIVPEITWVATANAVRYVGATPVFADVEDDSWCLDAQSFESKITRRTKAVMPVHLYGHPARMTKIVEIARRRGLYIVEDAAPAIGTEWESRRVGTFGDFSCFSFQGAKLLVTGEGGMLACNDPALYEKALKIWDQGRDLKKTFWIDAHGLKYKMSNIQAALGLAQLERCDEQIEMKRRLFEWYQHYLDGCPHLQLMPEVAGARSIYWMSSCRVMPTSPIDRETLRAELKRRNVDTRPVFPAISQYPIWTTKVPPQPRAAVIGATAINLPSGVCLAEGDARYVSSTIRALLAHASIA